MKRGELPGTRRRGNRLIRERLHAPHKFRLKLPDHTVCLRCGAVFHKGRWTWESVPSEADEELCQGYRRVNDAYPAAQRLRILASSAGGHPVILGQFFGPRRD